MKFGVIYPSTTYPAVPFDSLDECVEGLAFEHDALRVKFEEVEVLESWTGFLALRPRGLALVSAPFEVVLFMHSNPSRQKVVHDDETNVLPATLCTKKRNKRCQFEVEIFSLLKSTFTLAYISTRKMY